MACPDRGSARPGWGRVASVVGRRYDRRTVRPRDDDRRAAAEPDQRDRPRLQQLGRASGPRCAPPSAAARPPTSAASTGSSAPTNADVIARARRGRHRPRDPRRRGPAHRRHGPGPPVQVRARRLPADRRAHRPPRRTAGWPAGRWPTPSSTPRSTRSRAPRSSPSSCAAGTPASPSSAEPVTQRRRTAPGRPCSTALMAGATLDRRRHRVGDGRDHGRQRHAGPARRVRRAAAGQGRDAGRAGRPGAHDARPRDAAARSRAGPSTSSAPAPTARTPSTSRPWPRSSSPARGGGSSSTATGRRPRPAARRRARGARRRHRPAARRAWPRTVAEVGIGFCFAPVFHAGMRHAGAGAPRARRADRFNFLGPLTNPARVTAAGDRLRRPRGWRR